MFNFDGLKEKDQTKSLTLFNLIEMFNDLYGVEKHRRNCKLIKI